MIDHGISVLRAMPDTMVCGWLGLAAAGPYRTIGQSLQGEAACADRRHWTVQAVPRQLLAERAGATKPCLTVAYVCCAIIFTTVGADGFGGRGVVQHLNFCRQMVRQFTSNMAVPNFPRENKTVLSHAIDLAKMSTKFILPRGGRLYDDKQFRALDESERLRLPYPMIALEYEACGDHVFPGQTELSSKRILFARERDDYVVIMPICWRNAQGIWGPLPEAFLPLTGYLDRTQTSYGRSMIRLGLSDPRIPLTDYSDEVGALLCFLNALQCTNVQIARSPAKKTAKAMRKALPFDDYHLLTVAAPKAANDHEARQGEHHRSPREHLRRGHIRRLESGARIWVNATVVNAGVGGKITKDYRIAARLE